MIVLLLLLSACGSSPAETVTAEADSSVTEAITSTLDSGTVENSQTVEIPETEEISETAEISETSETSGLAEPSDTTQDEPKETAERQILYRYASKEEGAELLMANEAYYDGFSQNDLDFRFQKVGATMEEYRAFAREQSLDFTEEEIALVDGYFNNMERTLAENGYKLPPLEEVVLIKMTLEEEKGAGGYTHGTQIYIDGDYLQMALADDDINQQTYLEYLKYVFWHELFHCLTRSNPDFQKEMYSIIHFTIVEEDFPLPPTVFEYHISNPDVEHHNSYASFRINGEDIDCFTDLVTTKHFETPGETFFSCMTTALIPIDGTDIYYTPEQAENFDDVFGKNTGYVIDPEECMADNFTYAMQHGINGKNGEGYQNPEIIAAIIEYLSR